MPPQRAPGGSGAARRDQEEAAPHTGRLATASGALESERPPEPPPIPPPPLTTLQEDGTSKDLFEEAFGKRPDLSAALGGGITNAEIFDYNLDSFKLTDERKKLGPKE